MWAIGPIRPAAVTNKSIYIMCNTDSNYIKPMVMLSRETDTRHYSELYARPKTAGFTAQLLCLDNEVFKKLISKIEKMFSYEFESFEF